MTQVEILSGSRPTSSKSTVGADSNAEPETKKQPVKKVSIEDKENDRFSPKINEVFKIVMNIVSGRDLASFSYCFFIVCFPCFCKLYIFVPVDWIKGVVCLKRLTYDDFALPVGTKYTFYLLLMILVVILACINIIL